MYRLALFLNLVLLLGLAGFGSAETLSPCAKILDACKDAGFTVGGVSGGKGLWVDCVEPLMRGSAQGRIAKTPLPDIDQQTVAACRRINPDFGPRAQSTEQEKISSPENQQAAQSTVTKTPIPTAPKRPNIVFILTDDLALNLVQYMPHVLQMQKDGVTFSNYFVTDSLCCPSRSSIFTGRYPHSTGIFRNQGDDGGYIAFRNKGHEQETFAVSLSAAGYRTAMMGKYLNGYLPAQHPPAPGWTVWAVAGMGYREFNYALNENGKVMRYGSRPDDYLTDVLSGLAASFIKQGGAQPFFIEVATFAPHAPYIPAPRDADAFPALLAPRNVAYDAAPDSNSPRWLTRQPSLSDADKALIDRDYRKRAQSVLAVDKLIGMLQDAVDSTGQRGNTYFIFSSDNGYHMGEHRLMPGKMTAYDTDIHVPLIVTGPGVPAGIKLEDIVENIDLCPTFTEVAGASLPSSVDGHSLRPFLSGQKVRDWRTATLVEHHGPRHEPDDPDAPGARSGNPPSYEALRSREALYVEYTDGDREYHDLVSDPFELHNTFSTLSSQQKASLRSAVAAAQSCHDGESCWAAQHPQLVAAPSQH